AASALPTVETGTAAGETEAGPEAAEPAVAAGRWAVTFGAYASARDAQAVIDRLRQAGLEGFSEQDTVNGRQAWRVRVGPYADRALAEAGRLRAVRIRNDVNAQVIALDATGSEAGAAGASAAAAPADAPAPATTAAVTTPAPAPAPAPAKATVAQQPAPARETPRPATTP